MWDIVDAFISACGIERFETLIITIFFCFVLAKLAALISVRKHVEMLHTIAGRDMSRLRVI